MRLHNVLAAALVLTACGGGSSKKAKIPQISALVPDSGPLSGGTEVAVLGKSFVDGMEVLFDGVPSPSVTFVSGRAVLARTPAGSAPGAVDVEARTGKGRGTVLPGGFTYVGPPVVTSSVPGSGPTSGGTRITIFGSRFDPGTEAWFGGVPLTIVTVTASTIEADTPPGPGGVFDLVVQNPDGQRATLAGAFEYIPPPTILAISPEEGPEGGGTPVTVTGFDFRTGGGTSVTFGAGVASGVVVVSETEITCSAAPGMAGSPVDVTVINPDGQTGVLPSAYSYTFEYSWYDLSSPGPFARESSAMAHDSGAGEFVLFGGINIGTYDDTWVWNGGGWSEVIPGTRPPSRALFGMAYDSGRGVTVLFGGGGATVYDDTWEWNGADWSPLSPAPPITPPARQNHCLVYDSARGFIVLFGGWSSGGTSLDDTWEYDGTNWYPRAPAAIPPARINHAMAYDSGRGVTVLFGGLAGSAYVGDTWEWNGTNWVQRFPARAPFARDAHQMAYDPVRGLTILHGGFNATVPVDDTWEWDGVDWTEASPGSPPPARLRHAMAADGGTGEILLFGGNDGGLHLDDTWLYGP